MATLPPGPLASVRVVDLTDLRGALCGRILADLGADVVKVEPPDLPPALAASTAYRYRNANKRGVVVDLEAEAGGEELSALLADCDILIENGGPDGQARLGLVDGPGAPRHPRLVHVALTDFGLDGPRASWQLEPLPAMASSGALFASGFPDLPPCWLPGFLAHDCASVYGAAGAVAALLDRRRSGQGQQVEISTQEAALAGTTPWSIAIESYLSVNPFLPAAGKRNAAGSYWVLPAKDGWVRTVIGNLRQWTGFLALMGDPEELSDPMWKDMMFRVANSDVVRLVAEERLTDRTRVELFEQALKLETTIGVLHTPSEFVAHEQTQSRRFFLETGFAGLEGAPFASAPYKLSASPASVRRAAPAPGEHDPAPFPARREPEADAGGDGLLLDGLRVVEFGAAAVMPEMSGVLSELGAQIIKIESLAHPDVLRATGYGRINCGFAFNTECRGRQSVALDIATEEGRALALELCAAADIVAENYRGGALDKVGLGYEHVRRRNPSVIYVSSQGYGRGGPYGQMPAYGPLNNGFAGLHHLWNHPDAPYPCGTSLNHPDHIAGKLLAVAVLAAIAHRDETGEGQLVDMAQTEAAAFLMGHVYLDAALTGVEPGPQGNRSDSAVPHGVYPAAGEDRWVAVAVPDDDAWGRLVDAVGWEADPALDTLAGRLDARDTIDEGLSAWTAARSPEAAAEHLQAAGVSAMPVMGPADHHADAHLAARRFLVDLEHPEVGPERHVGNPIRFSRLPQRTAVSAPLLGADTEDVLEEVLGLALERIAELRAAGICR